jgi:DNA-directed RNA polymerase specialized sigma24 family protein
MEQLRSTVAVLGSRAEVAYGTVVDAALAELDPLDAGLITLIDIDGAPFSQAVLELDLPSGEARDRLARARFAVRAALDRYLQS